MKAVVLTALGKKEKALSALAVALKMAEPEGYVYLFLIQGTPLLGLLRQAIRKGIHKEYARKILTIMEAEQSKAAEKDSQGEMRKSAESTEPLEPLSERELEVLRLLNSKLSVPEIAEELTVAPSTVRTHIRIIYNKLGVHGRIEALQKAKDLSLI
jgi:LuxR family maltose regulon positive regulatory protein